MHQRGPALVRIGLFSLLLGALVVALVEPSLAGTPDAPEVQDPTGDVARTGGFGQDGVPATVPVIGEAVFDPIDIVKAYVQANNTTVSITIETVAAPLTGADAKYNATFVITTGATVTNRSVQRLGTAVTGPTGTAAATVGNTVVFTVPATSLGVVTGSSLTNLAISTANKVGGLPIVTQDDQNGVDTAGPSTVAFVFNGPSPDDTDADGIPDACEILYFNNTTTKSNPSEDQDNDTLTLGQECALGTDPTKADSDGDGVDDKKDPFPTDATKGGTTSGTTSNSGSSSKTSSTSKSGTGSGSNTGTNTGVDTDGDVQNFGDAVEKLKGDVSYLGTSAGGFLAVLILAILALAVRWSL